MRKVRPYLEKPSDAVKYFDSVLRDKRYTSEAVERYGLINALMQDRKYLRADKELTRLYETLQSSAPNEMLENHRLGSTIQVERKAPPPSPMIETLAARVKLAGGQTAEALDIYKAALKIYPQHRALTYDYADALLRSGRADTALKFVSQQSRFTLATISASTRCRPKVMKRSGTICLSIGLRRKSTHGRGISPQQPNNCKLR